MPTIRHALIAALALAALAAAVPAAAQDRTYNQPRWGDNRLDWCLEWGVNCGRPAADAFCQRRRFTRARVFRAEVVGRSQPTQLFGSSKVCHDSDACTAFAYITCEGPIESSRVFANPAWQGERLDVCREWGANCGKPAADAYCRKSGFSDAFSFFADPEPGRTATRVIGSGQVCRASYCRGFQQIVCR